jgi:hypothetical protein
VRVNLRIALFFSVHVEITQPDNTKNIGIFFAFYRVVAPLVDKAGKLGFFRKLVIQECRKINVALKRKNC